MQSILKLILKRETGFMLAELIVAIAIAAIIGTGISVIAYQVIKIDNSSRNRMEAIKQVENAFYYINRDVQMAQTQPEISGSTFPLTITYCDWENTVYSITYNIIDPLNGNPKTLERSETITPSGYPPSTSTFTVATYIDDTMSNCSYSSSLSQLTVVLTSKAGGYQSVAETRTLKVRIRPIQ